MTSSRTGLLACVWVFTMTDKKRKIKSATKQATQSLKRGAGSTARSTKAAATYSKNRIKGLMPTSLAFLSTGELLKWSEGVTQSAASVYDKALDAEYLRTHIGGGNHRMFDGGHDPLSAWEAAKEATQQDSFAQEIIGYTSALWKDVSTEKGLPFVTWSKENYDATAEWISTTIPVASKSWFYDLMSFDVFELLSTSLGVAGMLYALSKNDKERLSEILGSMGIVSIMTANPLMGIATVLCAAHSYAIKKNKLDKRKFASGAGIAGISITIFSILGLPLLIEVGIVLVTTQLMKKASVDHQQFLQILRRRVATLPPVRSTAGNAYKKLKYNIDNLKVRNAAAID